MKLEPGRLRALLWDLVCMYEQERESRVEGRMRTHEQERDSRDEDRMRTHE